MNDPAANKHRNFSVGNKAAALQADLETGGAAMVHVRGERFFAFHQPVAYWVSPAVVPVHGGSVVSIRGSGFPDTRRLKVTIRPNAALYPKAGGDVVVAAKYVSAHEIQFVSPEFDTAFRGDLHLSCNGGVDYHALGQDFEAHDTPHIERLAPYTGPQTGGTTITVFTRNMEFEAGMMPK